MDPRDDGSGVRHQFDVNVSRRKRWEWILNGLDEELKPRKLPPEDLEHRRTVCEILMDNAMRVMERHSRGMFEDAGAGTIDIPVYTTFAFPLVRRVYAKLISNEFVSVQPMSQPTGNLWYLDALYGSSAGSIAAGDRMDQDAPSTDYANTPKGTSVRTVRMSLSKVLVEAEARKLKAIWDVEDAQDLQSQFGMDADSTLMDIQSGEIQREIDQDLLEMIEAGATAGNVTWNQMIPASGVYSTIDPKIWRATLYDAITDANNLIFKARYRNANFIVGDPDSCAILEKLEQFKLFEGADDALANIGVIRFGTLAQKYRVYKAPWFTANKLLLGFKGPTWLEAGAVYAPYVPMWITPPFVNPDDQTISRGMMSRYAKAVVEGDFFATVTITNS